MKKTTLFDRGNFVRTRSQAVLKMFYRRAIRLWPLFVATMLIAPGIFGMGATAAYAAGHSVPFRGSYSGTVAFGSNGAPLFSATGHATHIGRSASEGYVVFTTAPTSCAGGVPNDNFETLTAANGDSFTIVSHDVACPTGPNQYHGLGDWDVVPGSGTGRFTGVTGQGTFVGNSDFNQGVFSMELTGTISIH